MSRLTYSRENQWRWLSSGSGIDVFRVSATANRFVLSVAVTLFGFGAGVSYWIKVPLAAWEPIETNGWAGEPQGREHGA